MSGTISALAKKDREQVHRDQELKRREQELAPFKTIQDDFKKDPIAAAQKYGVSYEAWTERLLKGDPEVKPKDPATVALEKAEALEKAAQARDEKEAKEKQQAIWDNEIKLFRAGVADAIAKGPEYQLCQRKGADAVEQVNAVVRVHAQQTGKLMPLAEAIKYVEDYYKSERDFWLNPGPAAPGSTPAAPAPAPAKTPAAPPKAAVPSPAPATLTNRDTPSTPVEELPKGKDARWAAISKKYRGKLMKHEP